MSESGVEYMGGETTSRSRILVVLITALLMLATVTVFPARATSGGDDIESVRAGVAATFTYKINLLSDRQSQTDNADRKAVYSAGIAELASVRDSDVASATSVDALWALDKRAHDIYHATVAAADKVGVTPAEELARAKSKAVGTIEGKVGALVKWIEGCDDPGAIAIVEGGIAELRALLPQVDAAQSPEAAYALKDEAHAIYKRTMNAAEGTKTEAPPKEDPKTEAEKAAEALAKARRSTLDLITAKVATLSSAAEAEKVPAVVEIFTVAASDIEALRGAATNASSVKELDGIKAQVVDIYESAKEAAMAVRDGSESGPEDTLKEYLDRVVVYVTTTIEAAAPTRERSPETFDALVDAKLVVLQQVERVSAVAESGKGLDARWGDLNDSLRDFRLALLRHYIALGEPMVIGGIQIPG
ncbi:MAG TPA: hypothetical protein VLA29_01220 [Acidimicrobiia bacterium]|nr:hypothetical protein [Acidimicrobiia bacterium]